MKKLIALMLVGIFSLSYVPKSDAQDKKGFLETINLIAVVVDEVADGCDELRENGNLQLRCKNNKCVTVACISLRKSCEDPNDCIK
jgi:cadmium resistance protein CadD (predicted permease)